MHTAEGRYDVKASFFFLNFVYEKDMLALCNIKP